MEHSREVTIYDIAKNLDLSPSTVSRALNDDPTISKKTKKKIFETAAEMGYRSNPFAKNLRQQSSLTIGVMVDELNNSVTTPVLSGIEKIAGDAGYGVIITDSARSGEKEIANAHNLFHRRVDGIIVMPAPETTGFDHFMPFVEKKIPVIFLDKLANIPGSTSIVIDNVLCGAMATRHLIAQGCRRIVYLTTGAGGDVYSDRNTGYDKALSEIGIQRNEDLVQMAGPYEHEIEKVAGRIADMDPLPDGLFALSDLHAAICIRVFQERGLRVPDDIAVVGFNNELIGKLIKPALTTINYPGREMGETAARMLIDQAKTPGGPRNTHTVIIPAELIVRKSSLKKG